MKNANLKNLEDLENNIIKQNDLKYFSININNISEAFKKLKYNKDNYFKLPNYLSTLTFSKDYYNIIHGFNVLQTSLQFCFWYGKTNNYMYYNNEKIDSQYIIKILDNVFEELNIKTLADFKISNKYSIIIQKFKNKLLKYNIPFLEKRLKILDELLLQLDLYTYSKYYNDINYSISLLNNITTFKKDIFFKKGYLAILMSFRMFKVDLYTLLDKDNYYLYTKIPVPIDYRIPQFLIDNKLLNTDTYIENKIKNNQLFIEGSLEELELRSSSYWLTEIIKDKLNLTGDELDQLIFNYRKQLKNKHHLCITTNY